MRQMESFSSDEQSKISNENQQEKVEEEEEDVQEWPEFTESTDANTPEQISQGQQTVTDQEQISSLVTSELEDGVVPRQDVSSLLETPLVTEPSEGWKKVGLSDTSNNESSTETEKKSSDKDTNVTDKDKNSEKCHSPASSPSCRPPVPFARGDHVYQWCQMAGIKFPHHAIIMHVYWDKCDELWMVHVNDSSHISNGWHCQTECEQVQ